MPPEPRLGDPEDARAALDDLGLRFTEAQWSDLADYRDLLSTWNARMNLVGPSAMAEFWTRHVADSAQLLELAPSARVWADLGSGAGLPGVVVAILLKGDAHACVHLVESVAKRCRFLAEVVQRLGLPAIVHNGRAEALEPTPVVDVVTARAVAPLDRLLEFAAPYLAAPARGLFLKGRQVEDELTAARRTWRFGSMLHRSKTDVDARIVEVWELRRG